MSNRAVLIVLDGFGIGKDSPFNAINNAQMPFYRDLLSKYPHSELITHGEQVGLPEGVMGNSEVGHMTMGAGRIVFQDLTRISKSIREKDFFKNKILRQTIEAGAKKTGRVHLIGLLSDAGVHSHIDHLFALLDLCKELGVPEISIHCFLDGRDTPPDSASGYVQSLIRHPSFRAPVGHSRATLASLMGRYWAMDRDKRWDRVKKAFDVLTGQAPEYPSKKENSVLDVIQKSHENGITDEFIEPTLMSFDASMKEGDSVIFFNFRADRAREITEALTAKDFHWFNRKRGFQPSAFCGMTVYEKNLLAQAAFSPQNLNHIFGEWLEKKSLTQFRIAETEKYAHVTFFFNGGKEPPFKGEDRVLVPSPKDVATYDLKPEMSAFAVANEAAARIAQTKYDFVLMNFANADMVGHTGNYKAAIQAMEALDRCLSQVIGAAEKNGYNVLLTADHGNAEEMRDAQGRIHTQHTLNPVPAIWVAPNSANAPKKSRIALKDGGLQDVMPTLCELMKLPLPKEVTGKSLLPKG
ncbi:MAG: 2,3-bisphosphoglycerate-independent phosphoglycerate mutase [Bdellovibrionota bacterium]